MGGISSTLSTSNMMSAIEREIRSCYGQFSTVSVETINERASQIGKRLLEVETNLKADPISDPEVLTDLESLQRDLRTLTTRISIVMRQQGKTALASASPASPTGWQSLANKLKDVCVKETRRQFLEAAKQIKPHARLYRLAEGLQDRQTREARKIFIEAAKSKPADQKKPEQRERQKIATETLGNKWLADKVDALPRVWDRSDYNDRATLRFIGDSCHEKDNWDLAVHFPDRTLTPYDVAGCTARDLINMREEMYYSLVDLIDPKTAMEIFKIDSIDSGFGGKKHPVSRRRREALYLFNPRFVSRYALEMRKLCRVPIYWSVKEKADAALKAYKGTFPPEKFRALEEHPEYPKLIDAMKSQSETLKKPNSMRPGVTECIHKNWNELTQTYMADGLRHPITPVFIDKLNRAIRKVTSEMIGDHAVLSRADVEGGRGLGYRQQHDELSFNYLPQKAILREVNRYCDWVNEEIVACDRGEKNPILVATAACQRLVSIHPFSNGNGRTARFIADLILRRYGILPSGWKTEKIPVFLHEVVDEDTGDRIPPVTPTIAAERMLEGLANSYALVGTKKEGG